jgi:hypothetical protein
MLYESHITCDIKDALACELIAMNRGWKTSQIARDITLGEATYFYLTTHERDLIRMQDKLRDTATALRQAGINVIREKIELIIYDTKLRS